MAIGTAAAPRLLARPPPPPPLLRRHGHPQHRYWRVPHPRAACRRPEGPRAWTGAPRRSVFPYDARDESASCWWGCGAGPQGSPAGLKRARRGRPCGARSRVPSAGRGGAGRPRGFTLCRRAALLRPAVKGVQVRGGRPPGEEARGEGGRAGMSVGECDSTAEKREKLREWGALRLLKSNFDCTRPVGRTARRLVRKRGGRRGGFCRGRGHAARAAGRACPRGSAGRGRPRRRGRSCGSGARGGCSN